MIHVPTAPFAHYLGDAAAWAAALSMGAWVRRRYPERIERLADITEPSYFIALAVGGVIGAWLLGSLNTLRGPSPSLSHSVAGALAGAILAVELWKWRHGVRESTGAPFVLPIAAGIAIGRWGCLFAGMADGTSGTATGLPWAVDLGDGIGRHPVQIYEAISMALFLLVVLQALRKGRNWPWEYGFHALIIVYAAQRFLWEFLKPYPPLVGPFNLFHFVTGGLIIYGLVWIGRDRAAREDESRS